MIRFAAALLALLTLAGCITQPAQAATVRSSTIVVESHVGARWHVEDAVEQWGAMFELGRCIRGVRCVRVVARDRGYDHRFEQTTTYPGLRRARIVLSRYWAERTPDAPDNPAARRRQAVLGALGLLVVDRHHRHGVTSAHDRGDHLAITRAERRAQARHAHDTTWSAS